MHNDYNSWEKEVERERKEGLYYILFIIILGLKNILFFVSRKSLYLFCYRHNLR